MTPLEKVEGRAIPLGLKNVDTDVIIPAQRKQKSDRNKARQPGPIPSGEQPETD